MQFYKYKIKSEAKNISTNSLFQNKKTQRVVWITKISIIAFFLSLFLSVFSELFLSKSNVLFAILLLATFMILNIFSDMLGLAITSCQIVQVRGAKLKREVSAMCLFLIKNSDKVSSILCDVIGDACGVLCGVSGSIFAIILSSKFNLAGVIIGAIVSSIVVGFTVLFKAIAKNYAVNNSLKLVKKAAKTILKLKKIFSKNKLNNKKVK